MSLPIQREAHPYTPIRRWACAIIAVGAVAAGFARPASAQGPRAAAVSRDPTTSVLGVVGDSLHGGPLSGAVIMVDGQLREAVTDSIGRFRIDSVAAGEYRLGVFHPILDSLGTSLATRPVQFTAGKPLLVSLATPSGRTVRQAFCPGFPRHVRRYEHADSGVAVVVGRVLDPDSYLPVPDAAVTLSWIETSFRGVDAKVTPYARTTTTDTAGEFRFCAVPTGLNGRLRAAGGPDDQFAVEREISLESRIVTMTTVHLRVPPAAAAEHAVLTGEVQRPDGSPFAGATAILEGTQDSAVSDSTGTFTMRGLPLGTHMLLVRSVGFEPVSDAVELTSHDMPHVSIALMTPAHELSPVMARAEHLAAAYARIGFDRRRREGLGQFLTTDDIAAKHAATFSDLLAGLDGVQFARGAGACAVYVVDGHPLGRIDGSELDATLQPNEIGAIEVYRPASVPGEFLTEPAPAPALAAPSLHHRDNTSSATGNTAPVRPDRTGACMTVVVWTRTRLGVHSDLSQQE